MKPVTVSVGIPAFNEGKNIQRLLLSVLAQKENGIVLKEVFVMSDGSSDDTAKKVKALKDKRIKFFDDGKRLGKSARMDQLFRKVSGDVLMLMDADIVIDDRLLFSKVVRRGKLEKAGIAGVNVQPLKSEVFFEEIIKTGVLIMKDIAKNWNAGRNYLSYKGAFLALDGSFARSIHIPASIVNNDPYLYFAAVEKGFKPSYITSCEVFYRSPMTLHDHIKQSSRFQSSREELSKHFKLDWDKEYTMPVAIVMKSILKSIGTRPFHFALYGAVNVISKVKRQTKLKSTWSIANSTKGKISI